MDLPRSYPLSNEKNLADGSRQVELADGHHEVIDTQGNIEIDDVGSDKESYCEEVDVVGEDGQVHHVKKWHHHTMDHFQKHGTKWGCLTITGVALGVGLGIGIAVAAASGVDVSAQKRTAALAASAGTTIEPVSVIPAKGDGSSRRRLDYRSDGFFNTDLLTTSLAKSGLFKQSKKNSLRSMRMNLNDLTTATAPDALALNSDYHMLAEPSFSVIDPSVEVANNVNMISCYVSQIRGRDIGVGLEEGNPNPERKPYIALVDGSLCDSGNDGAPSMQEWAVEVETTAPGGGDGTYISKFMFDFEPGFQLWGELTNVVDNSKLAKSHLVYNAGPEAMKGGIKVDKTDPTNVKIEFLEQVDLSLMRRRLTTGQTSSRHAIFPIKRKGRRSLTGRSASFRCSPHHVIKSSKQKFDLVRSKELHVPRANSVVGGHSGKELQSLATTTLIVEYDSTEGVSGQKGSAISKDGFSNAVYRVAFSDAAILREEVGGNSACVDYDPDSSLVMKLDYVLFNANDGSRSLFNSGTMIVEPDNGYEAYISNWGAWYLPIIDAQGNPVAQNWLTDGKTIEKMGYSPGDDNTYTLKVAPGRLTNVKNLKVKLSDLEMVPLEVYEGGAATRKIAWDGQQLVVVETLATDCIQYDNQGNFQITSSDPEFHAFCFCYDNAMNPTTSGPFNYNDGFSYITKRTVLSNPTAFTPSSEEFSNGIEVMTDALWGKINLKYEKVQRLWMWDAGSFTSGETVTQTSSGASGTVFKTTATALKGFTCASDTCLTYTRPWMPDCSGYPTETSNSYWLELPAGTVLTQGSVSAVIATDTWGITAWEGIPVVFTQGNAFDYSADIEVSYPTSEVASGSSLSNFVNITGVLTKPDISNINVDEYKVSIIQGEGCTPNSFVANVPVKSGNYVITDGSGQAQISMWIDGDGVAHGFYTSVPTGSLTVPCDPDDVSVSAADITTALSTASVTCSTRDPQIEVACEVSQLPSSYQLDVKLDANSADFTRVDSWPPASGSDIMVNSVSKGPAGWVESTSGDIKPITGDIYVTFRVESTVNPGTSVPDLICYENCPDPNKRGGNNMDDCETYSSNSTEDCYYPSPSHLGERIERTSDGTCESSSILSDFPTGVFDGITGANATLTWSQSYDGSTYTYTPTATLTNRGYGCSHDNPPTFTISGGSCDGGSFEAATFEIYCEMGTDLNDFGQAHEYSFNSDAGILTDKVANGVAAISESNSNYYDATQSSVSPAHFGPFFPDTAATKEQLICDWNVDLVCSWQAFENLDNIYFYQSGQDGRRFTLEQDGESTFFQSSLNLLYTHPDGATTSNSGKDYSGATSLLAYSGPGQLTGLPTFCLDPATGQPAAECIPEGSDASTVNGFDIAIDPATVIEDSNGNKYYAKYQAVQEVYEVVGSGADPLCSGLTLPTDGTDITSPTLDSIYEDPSHLRDPLPTDNDLEANYLDQGEPQVIGGSTLKELQEAAEALAP